jgi:hypothetical protein
VRRWVPGLLVAGALLAALATRAPAVAEPPRAPAQWELLRDEDGIQIYRRTPEGDLDVLRGVAVVDAPVAKVASVVLDTSRRVEWFPDLDEARVVREVGRGVRLEYWRLRMPIGVSDREFHVRASVEPDSTGNGFRLRAISVSDPSFPAPEHVLATLRDCEYALTPVSADRTRVELIVDADPEGLVPSLIVNAFQSRNLRRNLEGLRRQAARSDVDTAPEVAGGGVGHP